MAADEQQPQDVVAIFGAVQPLGQVGLGISEVGQQLVRRQRLLLAAAAHAVEGGVATDEDQPGRGVARRPLLRPGLQRPETGLLECLLRRVQIAEIAQQRAERLGAGRGEGRVDPGEVGHDPAVPGLKMRIGRIS
jgi:hypothetical protein